MYSLWFFPLFIFHLWYLVFLCHFSFAVNSSKLNVDSNGKIFTKGNFHPNLSLNECLVALKVDNVVFFPFIHSSDGAVG